MRYELAKELKDAGYEMDYMLGNFSEYDKKVANIWIPLDELIEACGDDFSDLGRNNDTWFCNNEGPPYVHVDWDECKTPEEAVAKLWLALNKK
jgi:hypothetical protein